MSQFARAFAQFEEAFYGMFLVAGESLCQGESSHEERQQRCLDKLVLLGGMWNRNVIEWEELSMHVQKCIEKSRLGQLEQARLSSLEVQKALWSIKLR